MLILYTVNFYLLYKKTKKSRPTTYDSNSSKDDTHKLIILCITTSVSSESGFTFCRVDLQFRLSLEVLPSTEGTGYGGLCRILYLPGQRIVCIVEIIAMIFSLWWLRNKKSLLLNWSGCAKINAGCDMAVP